MKSFFRFAGPVAAMIAIFALTGCATAPDEKHGRHHPESPAAPAAASPAGSQMAMMDMNAMCEMHRKMMAAKTPEERKAMMDKHMMPMSPEMMQRHMAAMKEKCQ